MNTVQKVITKDSIKSRLGFGFTMFVCIVMILATCISTLWAWYSNDWIFNFNTVPSFIVCAVFIAVWVWLMVDAVRTRDCLFTGDFVVEYDRLLNIPEGSSLALFEHNKNVTVSYSKVGKVFVGRKYYIVKIGKHKILFGENCILGDDIAEFLVSYDSDEKNVVIAE